MDLDLKEYIRTIPDFPRPGIMFRDITTLLENPVVYKAVINQLEEYFATKNVDKIAGIESRGFIFGAALADRLNTGFVLIRKSGKLPGGVLVESYNLEYGTDKLEMHKDSIKPNESVVLIDDLLATGGTISAAIRLIEHARGVVAGIGFVIELDALNGRDQLKGYDVKTLVHY